jgi:hypothetical protein
VDELAGVAVTLQPDIILISESWRNSEILDPHLSVDGYEVQTYGLIGKTLPKAGEVAS